MNKRDEQMIVQHNGQDTYESDRQAGAIEMVQVILAGGAGTRLWPLSKDQYPSQLTGLLGQDSLLQAAVTRTRNLPGPWRVAPDPVVVCSNENRLITEEQTRVAGVHSQADLCRPSSTKTSSCFQQKN